jgi:hypothetical protein
LLAALRLQVLQLGAPLITADSKLRALRELDTNW